MAAMQNLKFKFIQITKNHAQVIKTCFKNFPPFDLVLSACSDHEISLNEFGWHTCRIIVYLQ